MMTREDILKELELWPVWTSRQPNIVNALAINHEHAEASETLSNDSVTQVPIPTVDNQPELITPAAKSEMAFQILISEDGRCLMVHGATKLSQEENALLQNINVAMRLKMQAVAGLVDENQLLQERSPQVIIAFGESIAQSLLQSTQSLNDLRMRRHTWSNCNLIVTNDLAHLLQHLQDKAKAWDDLCMALEILDSPVSV